MKQKKQKTEHFSKLKAANEKAKSYADSNIKIEDFQDVTMPEKIANVVKHLALLALFILIFMIFTGFVIDTTLDLVNNAINDKNNLALKDPILFVTLVTGFATSVNTAVLVLALPKLYKFMSSKVGNLIHKVTNKDTIQERKDRKQQKQQQDKK